MVNDSTYGSGPLNLTRRHGHFLNLTCDMAPLYTDRRGSIYSDLRHWHFSNSTGDMVIPCDNAISLIRHATLRSVRIHLATPSACSPHRILASPVIDWRQNLKRALETTLGGTEC